MAKAWKEYNKLARHKKHILPELNELDGSKWAQMSKSVLKFNGAIAAKRKMHGAAFPISLAKHIIEIYTRKNDIVLDPFLGVGTTLDAARLLGRNGVGFEINKQFIKYAKKGVDSIDRCDNDFKGKTSIKIINDTCTNLPKHIEENSIDLILTSPPYCNLLNKTIQVFGGTSYDKNIYNNSKRKIAKPYSANTIDFGNLNWQQFSVQIDHLMGLLYLVAKEGTYNVWVVRDYRDMPEGIPYVNLHGKIVELGIKNNWRLSDIVIWDQTDQRHLVKLGGNKARRFYFNIGHTYLVIFRKNVAGERFKNE